jgi:Phosphotransferase enzyme family
MPDPSDSELREALERVLFDSDQGAAREIQRARSEYGTSFPLEELDVELDDGPTLRLAFKQLGWNDLGEQARLAKPRFLHDPRREPVVYACLLEPASIGAPRLYGSVIEPAQERYWLFVEWVAGRELYQVGELALWEAAAGWLARMHAELAGLDRGGASPHLIDYDAAYYRRWIVRAQEFARAQGKQGPGAMAVGWLGERHDAIVEALLALPKTVIHGEFYASNVLVQNEAGARRVAPVDWELAATGPGLTDLAALVSGNWSEGDRGAIVSAYGAAAGVEVSPQSLRLVRLQLAIQWLGWAPPTWIPPQGQRHDWLGEALALAEELEL